jgi:DNA-binding NtrC family response regulator
MTKDFCDDVLNLKSYKLPHFWRTFGTIPPHLHCYTVDMNGKQHRILIVDDEPRVAFFFQQHLELVGEDYVVTAVNSGPEALKLLQDGQRFDLLITDLRMPGMDGLELLAKVGQIAPQTRTILVTAYGGADVWAEAERLRTFKALSKPLKISDLIATVREALTHNRQPKAGVLALTGEAYKLLTGSLENLRLNLGGRAIGFSGVETLNKNICNIGT